MKFTIPLLESKTKNWAKSYDVVKLVRNHGFLHFSGKFPATWNFEFEDFDSIYGVVKEIIKLQNS